MKSSGYYKGYWSISSCFSKFVLIFVIYIILHDIQSMSRSIIKSKKNIWFCYLVISGLQYFFSFLVDHASLVALLIQIILHFSWLSEHFVPKISGVMLLWMFFVKYCVFLVAMYQTHASLHFWYYVATSVLTIIFRRAESIDIFAYYFQFLSRYVSKMQTVKYVCSNMSLLCSYSH